MGFGSMCEVEGEVVKSGEQVGGEVEGGFGLQWWWWFLGGKGNTGWYWVLGVDRGLTKGCWTGLV